MKDFKRCHFIIIILISIFSFSFYVQLVNSPSIKQEIIKYKNILNLNKNIIDTDLINENITGIWECKKQISYNENWDKNKNYLGNIEQWKAVPIETLVVDSEKIEYKFIDAISVEHEIIRDKKFVITKRNITHIYNQEPIVKDRQEILFYILSSDSCKITTFSFDDKKPISMSHIKEYLKIK